MPENECFPYYEPGDRITALCEAAVTGKRFVDISDDVSSEGNLTVSPATAGGKTIGVASHDQAIDGLVTILGSGLVVPVKAGGAITAGDDVAIGAAGVAVAFDTDGTPATLATGKVADNNAITWSARLLGDDGEDISVTLVDPGGKGKALSVDVDGRDITVNLATNEAGAGELTSTGTTVIAAIKEHDTASQLVDVANTGASSGAGVVAAASKANLAGGVDVATVVGRAYADAELNDDAKIKLY